MASAQNDKLVILRGDDTGGAFGRTLAFTIEAADGVSLEGCRAEWIFDGIVKAIDAPLVKGEVREIFYSHNETRRMALGVRYGTFRIIDAAGKVRTFTNTKAVEVTDNVARCYPGSSSATVHIGTTVTWEQVSGKPLLVKTINGEAPDASGNIAIAVGGDVKHSDFADIEVKEGMTLKEVGSMCNALAMKLKGTVAAFAAILALGAFADATITPQTDFGDISPTEKVAAVVHAVVDGAARPLPRYLHALDFADSYLLDAEDWYERMATNALGGACSAMRAGGRLRRNYDWTFDDAAEFVVRMSAGENRLASVGVASLGSGLTETEVTSGKPSTKYRALPGMTLDGINEAGVVCEINVDGGPTNGWHGTGANALHILAAVRWVLDHGTNAETAAAAIADRIKCPTSGMNFHFMVADAGETWIVENGAAHDVTTNAWKVLTNFALFDPGHAGGGKERYQILTNGSIPWDAVNFTHAYEPGNDWDSDFDSHEQHLEAIRQWAAQGADKEAHRGKTTAGGSPWWQTVHTAIYDFAAKTLRVAVQESADFYTFAVPAAGTDEAAVRKIAQEEIAKIPPFEETDPTATAKANAAIAAAGCVRTNEYGQIDLYGNPPGIRMGTSEYNEGSVYNLNYGLLYFPWGGGYGQDPSHDFATRADIPDVSNVVRTNDTGAVLLFSEDPSIMFDAIGNLSASYDGDTAYLNWTGRINAPKLGIQTVGYFTWDGFYEDFTGVKWMFPFMSGYGMDSTHDIALRSQITDATNGLISASNPAFSNAVLEVQISTNDFAALYELKQAFADLPIDPVTGGISLGALLAALASAVAWLKKNKVQTLKLEDESIVKAADNGVVKLDDFFKESNTLLTGVIDARLPYPLNTDGTIKDRAVNVVTSGAFVIPEGFKDLLIRYTGVPTSLTFSGTDASIADYGDDLPTETGDYLITVTRTKAAECYIRIIKLEARA